MVLIPGCPLITHEKTKKIIQQMEKSICQIKNENCYGTGFFCKIPFPDKDNFLPVLITAYHILHEEALNQIDKKIHITFENEQVFELDLNKRIKYTNKKYDITIIEIKENDNINKFLELEDYIIKDILVDNNNMKYKNNEIYSIQYAKDKLATSYGILTGISEDNTHLFSHKCSTELGSGGSPILNLNNNKVIGVHSSSLKNKNINIGTFLNYPIKEFIKQNYKIDYEKLLKEFNEKYNLKIRDTKIEKLDLRWKGLENIGFEDLCKIEFKELKELILNNNKISDIKALSKAKFEKLEILDLSQNMISNINMFENVNFKGLKQLYLCYNNISDIKVFEKGNLEKLEILYLNDNKIDKNKNALIISNLKTKIENFQV